ncbi:12705_t:CDS:2 [Ambispora gerdemannii]|uniref:12705_t:CDS:1 n=1 Tax=Ambispora gerdemannii TaxID=144530 RepID=A0A9N9C2H4_9GLOM|nr:12705_t:CDS:2 [Ambispora gerdemannii]
MNFKHCLFIFTLFLLNLNHVALADSPTDFGVVQYNTSSLTCDHLGRFMNFLTINLGESTVAAVDNLVPDFCKLDNPCPSSVSTVGYQQLRKISSNNSALALGYAWNNVAVAETIYISEKSNTSTQKTSTRIRNLFPPTLKIYYYLESSASNGNAKIYNQYIADNKITDGFSVVTAPVDKLFKK